MAKQLDGSRYYCGITEIIRILAPLASLCVAGQSLPHCLDSPTLSALRMRGVAHVAGIALPRLADGEEQTTDL